MVSNQVSDYTGDKASALALEHWEVTVTVERDLNGDVQPAEDTPVYLFTAGGSYLGVSETTDENGRAVFDVPAGDYKVRADLFTQQYWSEVFNQSDADVTIEDGTAVVTVSGQGLPLTGVSVYAFNDQGAYLGLNDQTDGQGRASFRLPAGKYDFRADYLGSQYFSGNTTLIAGTDNPVAISTGGGNLKLTVEKATGDPLAGMKCYLFSTAGAYLGQSRVTAGDGTADFNLADGSYRIRVDYLGYQYWTDAFSVPDTAETYLTIAHQDVAVTVTGDENGDVQPKADVPVYLFTPDGAYLGQKVTTDAVGRAVFSLPEKAYTVRADYLGQQFWSTPFTATDTAVTIAEGTAAVTVTRASDVLENVKVYVFSPSDAYLGISETTDADGWVSFRLPAGTYKLRADYLDNQFWATAMVTGDTTSDIALSTGGGTFALMVQKQAGEALAGVPVYVFSSSGAYLGLTATTDAQGQVSFALADGDYRFRADYLGYQFWTPDETIPTALSDVLAIAHQNVSVTVNQKYGLDLTLLENVPVYLFTADGAYLGIKATTDAYGQVSFNLPAAEYKVRADHLSSQTWSPVFNQTDAEVNIAFGKSTLHVVSGDYDLFDAPVYLFTEAGAYLGEVQHTDSAGLASFMVPAGAYKFRVDHDGNQAWSDVINILAGEETVTYLDLDVLLSDLTLNPDPVRFDGTPPAYHPEKLMLATFGPLTGLLPASSNWPATVDKLYYFIDDHLGTPQIVTDDAGAVVWKAAYRPFGAADIAVDKITNNLRFAGQYYDQETGLHYNYHRYYDPATGRYLTADPIGLAGGINLFAYVGGNPVNYVDPYGLMNTATWGQVGGGLLVTPVPGARIVGGVILAGAVGYAAWQTWQYWQENTENEDSSCEDAQAPGQPTEKDGFVPPKNWDGKKVKAPNGRGYGWPDKKGNIWVPTGPKGHGGEHWDVQKKKGGYVNVYPGGKVRP